METSRKSSWFNHYGWYLQNGKLTVKGDTTGPVSAHMVLQDP